MLNLSHALSLVLGRARGKGSCEKGRECPFSEASYATKCNLIRGGKSHIHSMGVYDTRLWITEANAE